MAVKKENQELDQGVDVVEQESISSTSIDKPEKVQDTVLQDTKTASKSNKDFDAQDDGGFGLGGVQIKVKEYVKCKIGPKYYEFKPGGIYRVPKHVKEILAEADKLGVL